MKTKESVYGSFIVGDCEFAIESNFVQEVVNSPSSFSSVPMAPEYSVGVFSLREVIIPTIDMSRLFNIKYASQNYESMKIVIIEHNGQCLGLLVDSTSEILKVGEKNVVSIENSIELSDKSFLKGLFQLDDGKRLVFLVDVLNLLDFKLIFKTNDSASKLTAKENNKAQKRQCISFKSGNNLCALDINEVQEIIKPVEFKKSALSKGSCIGMVVHRNLMIPVIHLGTKLGYSNFDFEKPMAEEARLLLFKLEKGWFSILVDSVHNIIGYYEEDLKEYAGFSNDFENLFKACIELNDQSNVILLNSDYLLTDEEINYYTSGHKKLYNQQACDVDLESQQKKSKSTYITFKLNHTYGLNISDVHEVINFPNSLITPPNVPSNCLGVLSLRGELISMIDTHKLYQLEAEDENLCKVLIFERNNKKYGLVVNSIDSIVSMYEHQKTHLHTILYKERDHDISDDLVEAIQVKSLDKQKNSNLLILDLDKLTDRLSKAI